MATWGDVRSLALAMPGASEEDLHGLPSWKVNKKLFVWARPLRKSDLAKLGDATPKGDILGVRVADLEMKEVLLRAEPEVIFTIPHFEGYPAVLVRLAKISKAKLKELIVEAWLARAGKRAVDQYLSKGSPASKSAGTRRERKR